MAIMLCVRRNGELEELIEQMRGQKNELTNKLTAVESERDELDSAMQVSVAGGACTVRSE